MSLRKDGFRLSVRISMTLLKRVDKLAKRMRLGRSEMIREAIERGLRALEEELE